MWKPRIPLPSLGLIAALSALPVGVALRLLRLGEQVLGGDELHAVRAALAQPVGTLLTTYQTADPCLPLAAFYRLLMDLGIRPSEWTFRLPVLLFALATPLVLPLLALHAGWLGRRGTALLAWLLAFSPLLVLYGRIVRPYGIVVPLVFTALVAFDRFHRADSREQSLGWGGLYAVSAAFTLYLHLPAGPILAAPFLFAAGQGLVRKENRGRLPLLALGVATTALVAAFLLPAWESFRALMAAKGSGRLPGWETLESVPRLLAGTPFPAVVALFWGTAAVGCALLIRQHRRLGLYLLTAVAGQFFGLLLLAPFGLESPAVFSRYLLPTLPIVLLWIAYVLDGIWKRADIWKAAQSVGPAVAPALAPGLLLFALFLSTPLARPAWWASSFLHHADTLRFDRSPPTVAAESLPQVYPALTDLPPGPIIEAPVRTPWRFARAVPAYQRHHRRRVLLLAEDPKLCDDRLALRNHVCPTLDSLRQSGAVAILVNLDPVAEEERVAGPPPARDRRKEQNRQRLAAQGRRLARWLDGERGAARLTADEIRGWVLEE